MRNAFAHSFDHNLTFGEQSIADRWRNLSTAQAFLAGYEEAATRPNRNLSSEAIYTMQAVCKPPRWRFRLAVEFLAQSLAEIRSEVQAYSGADFLAEVRALSANTRMQISATGTIGSPAARSGELST
mgnify:CR=1 FL=1